MKWIFLLSFFSLSSFAQEEASNQPYIDSIKKRIGPGDQSGSLIKKVQQKLGVKPKEEGSFTQQLKASDPEKFSPDPDAENYSTREKMKLPKKDRGGAIAALKEGRSELRMIRELDDISSTFGIKVGTLQLGSISASSGQVQPFETVYGDGWNPDINFFYEYQLLHSEGLGSLGLFGNVGFSYYRGTGIFEFTLTNPVDSSSFGSTSRTQVQFYSVPLTLGAKVMVNFLNYVRPIASAGGTFIPYMESVEGSRTLRGWSASIYLSGGVAILLDWLSKRSTWDAYEGSGVKHTYLTVEYTQMIPVVGDVEFNTSGVFSGVSFEF